jgi:hypothetical protein
MEGPGPVGEDRPATEQRAQSGGPREEDRDVAELADQIANNPEEPVDAGTMLGKAVDQPVGPLVRSVGDLESEPGGRTGKPVDPSGSSRVKVTDSCRPIFLRKL